VGRRARGCFEHSQPLLCAESVFLAVTEALGVSSGLIPRAASGFCSGVARTSGTCGGLNGGIMALGVALGRGSGADSLEPVYAAVQEYEEFFRERFGTLNCRALTGCDFLTPEGQTRFREGGIKHSVCLPLVEAAAAQVIRILAEQ
jgi:C_GCAxxG_C_C family probable redox protein